jgi:hypothetical protein
MSFAVALLVFASGFVALDVAIMKMQGLTLIFQP